MSLSHPLTQLFADMMLNSWEVLSKSESIRIARAEKMGFHEDSILAARARAIAYVMGEFIANEYETPDGDRICGLTREGAIQNWITSFANDGDF